MIPGLAARLGKSVDFSLVGADETVDCEAVKELNVALLHMVRNALDHGVESSEEREAAGKAPKAKLRLSTVVEAGTLVVELSDDGRGIDPERVKAVALAKGLLTPDEAARLSHSDCVKLIFKPGFSTAQGVSEVSGRGVGMDAVLAAVERKLHGSLDVISAPGIGTRVSIKIPLRGGA
jgi:two-component system chemotaxis sensor kinase CheA